MFGIAALVAVVGILAFFRWAGRATAQAHARFGPADVEEALAQFLDPQSAYFDEWELFLAWPIDDPSLESIRQECLKIEADSSLVNEKGISGEAVRRVAALLADLRARRAEVTGGT